MTTLSLIVRTFNEEAHIGRLLTGVGRQTRQPDEIVIVDSGSTDATLSLATAFGARIEHIGREEFSFGRALNRGIARSSGDVLVFASAHVYPVYDTWLAHLLRPVEADPRIALSYGRQIAPPTAPFSEARLLLRWFPSDSVPLQEHPFCNNANVAIRRSVWDHHHYNETLTGLEDLDWAKRALQAGHLLAYVAEAPVVHVHNESLSQIANRYRREAIAHKQIYHDQRLSLAAAVRLGLINIGADLRSAATDRSVLQHAAGIVTFRTAQFYGSYRGFAQQGPVPSLLRRRFYYPRDADPWSPNEMSLGAVPPPLGNSIDYDGNAQPDVASRR